MDSLLRGNDPGKARLYGAGIKGRGSDKSNPYILVMTGGAPVYFNISLNNKTFISVTFFKDASLVINISAFASKEVATFQTFKNRKSQGRICLILFEVIDKNHSIQTYDLPFQI